MILNESVERLMEDIKRAFVLRLVIAFILEAIFILLLRHNGVPGIITDVFIIATLMLCTFYYVHWGYTFALIGPAQEEVKSIIGKSG